MKFPVDDISGGITSPSKSSGVGVPKANGIISMKPNAKRMRAENSIRPAQAEHHVWNTLNAVYPEGWQPNTVAGFTDLTPDLDALSKSMINEQWPTHDNYTWTSGQSLNRPGIGSQSWGLAVERVFETPVSVQSASIVTGSPNSGLRHVTALVAVTYPESTLLWLNNNYQNTDAPHTVTLDWTGNIVVTKMVFIYIGRIMQTVGVSRNRYIHECKINAP